MNDARRRTLADTLMPASGETPAEKLIRLLTTEPTEEELAAALQRHLDQLPNQDNVSMIWMGGPPD